jgi:hypothetical protein
MKKKIILRLDPWTQLALWLIVILLAADRIRPFSPVSSAYAEEATGKVVNVNLSAIGGSPVDAAAGLPVRQVGPPPSNRLGPGPFPFEKSSE